MPTDLQPLAPNGDYSSVLTELATLTRDHLLHYRLEIGRLILDHFFAGSHAAYSDRDHTKEVTFNHFLVQHGDDLAMLGLKEHTLRQCVALRTVYLALPPGAREGLGYSRTLALVTVADPTQRAQLAQSAVAKNWSVAELKQTVGAAKAGLWYDTEPDTQGVQAKPLAPPAAKPPAPGRLVARAEKWQAEFGAFAEGWTAVAGAKASALQRARLKKALGVAIGQLQKLDKQIKG